jgi:hypothetical protein
VPEVENHATIAALDEHVVKHWILGAVRTE